MGIMEKISF